MWIHVTTDPTWLYKPDSDVQRLMSARTSKQLTSLDYSWTSWELGEGSQGIKRICISSSRVAQKSPLCAWWVICLSVPARQFRQSVCSPGADTGSDWCGGIGIETICLGNEELSFMAPQTWFKLLLFVVTCLPRGIKDKSSFIIPWIPHINSLPNETKHNLSFENIKYLLLQEWRRVPLRASLASG